MARVQIIVLTILSIWIYLAAAVTEHLFIAKTRGLFYLDLLDRYYPTRYIPLSGVTNAVSVDFDPVNEYVYWSDLDLGTVSRARIDGKDQEVIISNINQPSDIRLDVKSGLLYWTNTGNGTIERGYVNGTGRNIIVNQNLVQPKSIALDLENGFLYWSEKSKIGRSKLNGSQSEILINSTKPIYLIVDQGEGRIYWSEDTSIDVASTSGSNRSTIWQKVLINYLDISGDYLYFSNAFAVGMVNSSQPKLTETVFLVSGYIRSMCTYRTASGQNLLIVGSNGRVRDIDLGLYRDLGRTIIRKGGDVYSIDYDPNEDKIYWSNYNGIYSVKRDGLEYTVLLTGDWWWDAKVAITRPPEILFFTNDVNKTIESMTSSGTKRTVLVVNVEKPTSIAIDNVNKYICWTDTRSIQRADYNGDHQSELIGDLTNPYQLIIDEKYGILYYADQDPSSIHILNLNDGSTDMKPISPGPSHLGDKHMFTILGDYIYWLDETNVVHRMDRFSWTGDTEVILTESDFKGIRVVQTKSCDNNPCQNGGDCIKYNGDVFCRCLPGYDGKMCEIATGTLQIHAIGPLFGPVAGGTEIVIQGKDFPGTAVDVHIGMATVCNIHFANESIIIAQTKQVDDRYTGSEHLMSVTFDNGVSVPLGRKYGFKPNPTIISIKPLTTIKVGGTKLFVSGEQLNSVAEPLLKLYKTLRTVDTSIGQIINESVTSYFGKCNVINETLLICVTPNINITPPTYRRKRRDVTGDRYQLTAQGQEALSRRKNRAKRQSGSAEIEIIYVGVIFDGYLKYENLSTSSDTSPYGILTIVDAPTLDPDQMFTFSHKELLDVKGEYLDNIPKEDYKVTVGNESCDVLRITDTYLFCRPPQKEPSSTNQMPSHMYPIVVHVGENIKYKVGELKYTSNVNLYLGLACAGVIILAIVVVIGVCLMKSRKKSHDPGDSSRIEMPPVDKTK